MRCPVPSLRACPTCCCVLSWRALLLYSVSCTVAVLSWFVVIESLLDVRMYIPTSHFCWVSVLSLLLLLLLLLCYLCQTMVCVCVCFSRCEKRTTAIPWESSRAA